MQAVEEALQSEGLVLTRETDLEVVRHYLGTQRTGILHVVIEGLEEEDVETDVECTFGVTPLGEYIIRWYSESIEDVMTNGKTYLQPTPTSPGSRFVPDGDPVYFKAVREAFFGDMKAFVICTPAPQEESSGNST